MQDVELLSLPEEILQNVARHFTLAGWVEGPAQACRRLRRLELPKVDLVCFREGFVRPDPPRPTCLYMFLMAEDLTLRDHPLSCAQ